MKKITLKNILIFLSLLFVSANIFSQTAKVNITSNPPGATVTINGADIRNAKITTPRSINLPTGYTYSFVFEKSGYPSVTITGTPEQGTIHADLVPQTKNLSINSNVSGAQVYINGQFYGNTPLTVQLNPANYNVQVKMANYKDYQTNVYLQSDQSIYANLIPDSSINVRLPKGARLWINGQYYNINWGRQKGDDWQTIQLFPPGQTQGANIKVQYYNLTVEKYFNFNNQTISLQMLLQ